MQRPFELAIVLAIILAVVLTSVISALLAARRDARRQRDASLPFATALRDALAPAATLTPDSGTWRLDVTLHGRHVRLRVVDTSVLISIRLTPERWDLIPAHEFQVRGGLYSDPKDPYRTLDPAVLGEGWLIHGAGAERHVLALAPVLRLLLAPHPPPWIVDGALVTSRPGGDPAALAVEIDELARRSS